MVDKVVSASDSRKEVAALCSTAGAKYGHYIVCTEFRCTLSSSPLGLNMSPTAVLVWPGQCCWQRNTCRKRRRQRGANRNKTRSLRKEAGTAQEKEIGRDSGRPPAHYLLLPRLLAYALLRRRLVVRRQRSVQFCISKSEPALFPLRHSEKP